MVIIFTSFFNLENKFWSKDAKPAFKHLKGYQMDRNTYFSVELGQSSRSCNILTQHRELYDNGTDSLQREQTLPKWFWGDQTSSRRNHWTSKTVYRKYKNCNQKSLSKYIASYIYEWAKGKCPWSFIIMNSNLTDYYIHLHFVVCLCVCSEGMVVGKLQFTD